MSQSLLSTGTSLSQVSKYHWITAPVTWEHVP